MKRGSRLFRCRNGVVLSIAVLGLLLASLQALAGKLTITCWEFNRGNAKVLACHAPRGWLLDFEKTRDVLRKHVAAKTTTWTKQFD